ncbi:unnamed protein product, partial [Ascophyllum nodosum]
MSIFRDLHRTPHGAFPMGGSNCCITFHTHEFLFIFPVGGATIVTVARFLFFCPRASEQRVWHTEVVALPCPRLSAQVDSARQPYLGTPRARTIKTGRGSPRK